MRQTLPTRLRSINQTVEFGSHRFELTYTYDEHGELKGIFADRGRHQQTIQNLVADACIVISIALQYSIPPTAFLHSIAKDCDANLQSILGVICTLIADNSDIKNHAGSFPAVTASILVQTAPSPAQNAPATTEPEE